MTRLDAYEENVRRLYPKLLRVLDGAEIADAGCALCTALTILAFREGFSLSAALWLSEGSIRNGWAELKRWGMPEEAFPPPLPNGEIKVNEAKAKRKTATGQRRKRPRRAEN